MTYKELYRKQKTREIKPTINYLWDTKIKHTILDGNRQAYKMYNYKINNYKISYEYEQTKFKWDTLLWVKIENDSKQVVEYTTYYKDKRLNKKNFIDSVEYALEKMIEKESK